jgi:hypothetical protein
METTEIQNKISEMEKKIEKIEKNEKELMQKVLFHDKQIELNSFIKVFFLVVRKYSWLLIVLVISLVFNPFALLIADLFNKKPSDNIVSLMNGYITFLIFFIVALVIIICFFLFTKIPGKLKKDKSIFPD